MVPLRVGVLGPVTVWREGREVAAGQPKQLAVLGVLASRANRVVSLGQLVDAVWGDQPPASAEGGIYTYVAGLRRVLEPDRPNRAAGGAHRDRARVLVSSDGGYLLRLGDGGLDAGHFEERLGTSRRLRAAGDLGGAARFVDEALQLWRGQPYTGVPGPFAESERRRLAELRTTALEERADLLLAQGQETAAVPELTALVTGHPLRERARGLLMIALYRCGRQAEALGVFHDARERLAEDLGIDPGGELTRIYHQVLTTDPALEAGSASSAGAPAGTGARPEAAAGAAGPAAAPESAGPERAAGSDPPVPGGSPAQLPPEPAGFVGRQAELGWLHRLLPAAGPASSAAPPFPVALITGTAGVGKTTLAIRFARQASARFPDGQLYVNLRGFDPAGEPMSARTALQWFFDSLGVPARQVPAELDARSALLRTLLDGKRMLLLLDNAHDADQVRPLLPGSSGCMVLVTSRSQLTGLVVAGARPLPLDVLDPAEAAELVSGRLGAERAAAELDAVAALVRHSAGLPLALSVTCARAATRPAMRLADLAAELGDARGRLDALRTGEASTDLRAVFSWSADKLSPPAARMFRLLGLHAGPDITAAAAASLAAVPAAAARTALAELTRASLLAQDAAGRFSCHDLLHAYAAELAAAMSDEAGRELAGRRVLDHYLRTAQAAAVRLFPGHGQIELPPAADGVSAETFTGADGYEAALAWFSAEHRVLRNLVEQAAAGHYDEHCWKLAWCWAPPLYLCGRVQDVLAVQQTAVLAAGRLGDRDALAHVHYELGHVTSVLSDRPAADEHLRQALELFTDLGDRASVGMCHFGLGALLSEEGRYDEALKHAMEALRERRRLADHAAVAYSENAVGWILAHLGQPDTALWYCRRALALHREYGSRTGVAATLDSIAFAHGQREDFPQALAHCDEALAVYQSLGDLGGEATALQRRGDLQLAAGDADAAQGSWKRALELLKRVPGGESAELSERIVWAASALR